MNRPARRDPLRMSDEQLAKLDRDYPREGVHENVPEAHFKEFVKQFQRFEKRELTEDELKIAHFFWKKRGEDDYIAVESATSNSDDERALRAILIVGNRQFFARSEANAHRRPMGFHHLNP